MYKYSPGTIGLNKSWREHNCEDFNELNCDCYLPDMEYEECYCRRLRKEYVSNLDRRNYPEYTRWRASVFERDDYTCQICNARGGELNAHHLKGYKHNPDERIDINNGATLCVECHRSVHKGVIACPDRKKKG